MLRAPSSAGLVRLGADLRLLRGRAHEVQGGARRTFAALVAARLSGPVLWIRSTRASERLMGDGLAAFFEPARLIIAEARGQTDALWAAEEGLRAGVAPLVVAELAAPPTLTPVRRLHLAAEAGGEVAAAPPLALLILPEAGGAPGVESRWRLDPAPGWARDGRPRWRLARLRARPEPPAAWEMRIDARGVALERLPDPAPGPAPKSAPESAPVSAHESVATSVPGRPPGPAGS